MESELERLRKKVENFPSASSYNRLAELARLSGDNAEADEYCEKCIRLFPRNGQAYVIQAEIRLARNQRSEAIKLLTTAVERDPRSYTGLRTLSDLLASEGHIGQALAHLRQILTFKANDQPVLTRIADLERVGPRPMTGSIHRNAPPAGAAPGSSPSGAGTSAGPQPGGSQSASIRRGVPPAATALGSASDSGSHGPGALRPALPPVGAAITTGIFSAAGAFPAAGAPPTATARSNSSGKTAVLDSLCGEAGVRGAVVVDASGRVVLTKNLPAGQEDLLAALAADIGTAGLQALAVLGLEKCSTWVVNAAQGQVLAFSRDRAFSVVVLADPGVRPAMLELRARQALIDLGAA